MGVFKTVGFAAAVLLTLSATLLAVDLFRPLVLHPFAAWPIFLYLDAATTKEIYSRSPARFERVELNRVLVALVQRLGIVPAFPAILVLVEIPSFALISFIMAPALGFCLFGSASLVPCLAAGAGVLALVHALAWGENRAALKR